MRRLSTSLAALLASTGCMATSLDVSSSSQADGGVLQGRVVVDYVDGTSLADARALIGDDQLDWVHPLAADDGLLVLFDPTPDTVARLQSSPLVEGVEKSVELHALGLPNDPLYAAQWNLTTIDAPAGWRLGAGAGVRVAVIDTGVAPVADLAGTVLLDGASFVPSEPDSVDGNGHGTHVAGTIAQATHNGLGVAGVAPAVELLPIKALSAAGGGQSEWVAAAIDEACDRGAQILNLSLGGPPSGVITRSVKKAHQRGVLVVAAAGNTGREGVGSPARVDGVVAVSATGPTDEAAPYTTTGPEVVLSAPGGDKRQAGGGILQDTVDPGPSGHAFKEYQGTSMATPHVAGAAAVVWAASPGGGPEHVRQVLTHTSTDLGEPGHDNTFGHGRLDVGAAVDHIVWRQRGFQFLAAFLTALGLGVGFGPRKRSTLGVAVGAGLVAGGAFVLALLPTIASGPLLLLAQPLLSWPGALFGMAWARNPLVLSAAAPVVTTLFLGPTRRFGPWAAALSTGIGVHLILGAITGSLSPTWIPAALEGAWLSLNGAVSLVCAAAALGVQRVHARHEEE